MIRNRFAAGELERAENGANAEHHASSRPAAVPVCIYTHVYAHARTHKRAYVASDNAVLD
jgi:hypothetical protein